MNIDEVVARLVRGHARVLLTCFLVPVLLVLALHVRDTPLYVSTARVQLGTTVASSNVEADAVSTRAAALVQSPGFIRAALDVAGAERDVDVYAVDWVDVRRVGLSAVVDIAVTDTDPEVARAVASSLTEQLIAFVERTARQGTEQARRTLSARSAELAAERAALIELVQPGGGGVPTPVQQSALGALDRQLADVDAELGRLTTDEAATSLKVVVDPAALPSEALPDSLPQVLALAVLVGALLGLAVAGALETLRPTVPSARALARVLRVPLLAEGVRSDALALDAVGELAERVAVAARRNDVAAVVLLPVVVGVEAAQDLATSCLLSRDQHRRVTADPGALAGRATLVGERPEGRLRWTVTATGPERPPGWSGARTRRARSAEVGDVEPPPDGRRPVDQCGQAQPVLGYGRLDALLHQHGQRAGVVLVAPSHVTVNDLDAAKDVLDATGWPLLGVVGITLPKHRTHIALKEHRP